MIYEYKPRKDDLFFRDQPPLAFPEEYGKRRDLRGVDLVRSKVIGLPRVQPLDRNDESRKGKFWVLRCSCGNYFMMRANSIKIAAKEKHSTACAYCRHIAWLNGPGNKR